MSLPLEHLTPRDSPFARYDARWKLATIAFAIGATASLRSPGANAGALAMALLLVCLARVPSKWLGARLAVLLLTLLPFVLILPFTVDHGGPSFPLWGFRLSLDGVIAGFSILCKTLALVTLSLTMLASTPFHTILHAAQRLRVPGLLILLSSLSYRYIFLLLDELNRLRIAVRVRGFRNRANRHSYNTVGQITGTLLVRGSERAERVAQVMRCRGFDGRFRALDEFATCGSDVVVSVAISCVFVLLISIDHSVMSFAGRESLISFPGRAWERESLGARLKHV